MHEALPRRDATHLKRGGLLDPGVELLPKPFTIDSLARKLRQVLDGT